HMVPTAYVELERFPLTPNGKLDQRALPSPEAQAARAVYVAPRDEMESRLAAIWQDVLGVERAGVYDDFFQLGGHSLLAVRVLSAVRAAFGAAPALRTLFESPVLAGFAAALREFREADTLEAAQVTVDPAAFAEAAADPHARMPLSASQAHLWFLWKLDPASTAYNVNGALRFDGLLDRAALDAAFSSLVARHPALRMRFNEESGVPYQIPDPSARGELRHLDLTDALDVSTHLTGLARMPFDLAAELPVRATLVRIAADAHVLHLGLHHIVSDAESVAILFADLARFYRAHAAGERGADDSAAHAAGSAYRASIETQAKRHESAHGAAQLAYWRDTLAAGDGADVALALPFDRVRRGPRRAPGARLRARVPAATVQALRALSRERRATLFMTVLAAFNALLYRYTGQHDIRVGVPLSGRDDAAVADLVGFFVNTVVIRTEPYGEMRADQLIEAVRERVLTAHANQDVPFANVVKVLQPERELTRTPLFQVLVNQQQRVDFDAAFGGGLRVSTQEIDNGEAQFDLMLHMAEAADAALDLTLIYATDVFDAATIERLSAHFVELLAQWGAAPGALLSSFVLADGDAATDADAGGLLLRQLRNEAAPLDVVSRFAAQVSRRGNAIALSDGGESVSYTQLDAWSRAIAAELRRRGVGVETRVGVSMERSAALVAALLGVLRAGAAYVPLDPSYPAERLAYIAGDAQLAFIVTDDAARDRQAGCFGALPLVDAVAWRDAGPDGAAFDAPAPHPGQLAYVIYTSGSTGKPKGVGVTHANVARLFDATQAQFHFDERDVWTLFHSYAFDFSVWELFGALTLGGRLVIVPHWTAREPAAFHALLR
ncbi:condensation domain-containing protein, partial [Paraburkholderia phosphatilytica]|uniref:condensation domain-containing protein n=1 Tax=Paraburkholderia phosphatilytica TaxID=2282883 RepID=UPI0013DFB200